MNFLLALLTLFLTACHSPNSPHIEKRSDGTTAFTGEAMTMQYKVLVGHPIDTAQSRKINTVIAQTFHETDTIFNKWNPSSEVSELNQLKAGISTSLSPLLQRLFKETDQIVKLGQGRFDPTIEPLQQLWKDKLQQGAIPSDHETAQIASAIGWNKIDFSDGVFKKQHDNTQLDFGGVAKGLCIDLILERLKAEGFENLFVEWGGEIRASGQHPEGRQWTIYISRLGDNDVDHAISTLHLNDQAIATSGDYLQNWTIKSSDKEIITYFHIFDPKTLRPLEASHTSIASTSVLASNCALADGLATISMMFSSPSEATAWAESIKEQFPDISFWIISRSSF